MSSYNFEILNEKQIKERIRFLSDKLESIYEKIKPELDEFSLVSDELNNLLEFAKNATKE